MTLRVKVTARSAKSEVVGALADGTLKVRIAAPPEKGKANEALCALLAERYGVPRGAVTILSGHGSQLKLVKVEEVATVTLSNPNSTNQSSAAMVDRPRD